MWFICIVKDFGIGCNVYQVKTLRLRMQFPFIFRSFGHALFLVWNCPYLMVGYKLNCRLGIMDFMIDLKLLTVMFLNYVIYMWDWLCILMWIVFWTFKFLCMRATIISWLLNNNLCEQKPGFRSWVCLHILFIGSHLYSQYEWMSWVQTHLLIRKGVKWFCI